MKSKDLWQVRIPPDDSTEELLEAVREAVEKGEKPKFGLRIRVRLLLALMLHPIGVHHWVQYRTFDPGSGRIVVHPGSWVCATCPKGRLR